MIPMMKTQSNWWRISVVASMKDIDRFCTMIDVIEWLHKQSDIKVSEAHLCCRSICELDDYTFHTWLGSQHCFHKPVAKKDEHKFCLNSK